MSAWNGRANILYREREIGHILSDAQPRALVAAGVPQATVPVDVWNVDALAAEAAALPSAPAVWAPSLEASTPAALIYTSGTTGLAKGAILTHGNFAANGATLIRAWRFTAADRLLLALPLFHVHGLGNGLHCWLGSGARVRLLERFEAATAAAEFESFAPTVFFGVPTMYVRMLDWPADVAARVGSTARLFVGSSIFRLWKTLQEQMAPLPVFNRAFGGSRTDEVLAHMDRIVLPYRPRIIVYYCGSNDVNATESAAAIAARVQEFALRVRQALPKTTVYYVSVNKAPQKRDRWDVVDAVNQAMRDYASASTNVRYIDVNPALFDDRGEPRMEMYVADRLHLTPPAYEGFTSIIKPVLERAWASGDSK